MAENTLVRTWIDDLRRGDTLALSKLLAAYHPLMAARLRDRIGPQNQGRIEIEDILQQVYIEVFCKFDTFRGHSSDTFLGWLLAILDRKLIDAGRALGRQKRDAAREVRLSLPASIESHWNLLDVIYADSQTPSRVVRREEALAALMTCLSDIPDAQREVLRLRFLEGLSVQAVAARLGKTPAAVVMLSQRALASMRSALDRMGEFTRGV